MTLEEAVNKFRSHCMQNIKGKYKPNGWSNIDGRMICTECANHKRSALHVFLDRESAPFLNCFRAGCNTKRPLTRKDYADFGFTDNTAIKVMMNTSKSNKSTMRSSRVDGGSLFVRSRYLTSFQSDYFKERCGFIPTEYDMIKYKIIPKLNEVIVDNIDSNFCSKINKNEFIFKFKKIFDTNDELSYISYHSDNCGKFFFRSIEEKKVNKGQISTNDSHSMVTITSADMINTIVLAEGFFDIVNISKYYYVGDGMIYSPVGGFANFEKHIVQLYTKYIDTVSNLVLFVDSDVSNKINNNLNMDLPAVSAMLKRVFRKIPTSAFKSIRIIYSKTSKDFGDMREKITPVMNLVVFNKDDEPVIKKQ